MFKKATQALMLIGLSGALVLAGCSKGNAPEAGGNVGDQVKHQIIGIDPGAGLTKQTKEAMEDYGLSNWKLIEGSSAAMAAALDKAYKNEEPIIVTGWSPHWKFAKYELKYLTDPKGSYGQDEEIRTVVRLGLKDDAPSAYAMLDSFNWTPDDMAVVMSAIEDGIDPEKAAAQWVADNAATVDEWVKDLSEDQGKKLKLAYVAWDSEIASTNVVKQVLEQRLGYQVDMLQVEAGPMWAGIANGSADAMVAAWLPTTHEEYYERYQDQLDDLGVNLVGTKLGLVVPAYMEIDSIEDLLDK